MFVVYFYILYISLCFEKNDKTTFFFLENEKLLHTASTGTFTVTQINKSFIANRKKKKLRGGGYYIFFIFA